MIPASWTNLDIVPSQHPEAKPKSGPSLIGSVCDLLHACKIVDALRRKSESANNLSHEEEQRHAIPTGVLAGAKKDRLPAATLE